MEKQRWEKGSEKKFEDIIVENFPNMGKEIVNQLQEAQIVLYRINIVEKHTESHTNQTNKDETQRKNIKSSKGKATSGIQGKPLHLRPDLSAETLQARREWQDIFKVLKGENLQPRLLYPARISFKVDGEIKSFSDKQKLREFSTTKPALQQMLKGLIWSRNMRRKKMYKINPKQLRKWQ